MRSIRRVVAALGLVVLIALAGGIGALRARAQAGNPYVLDPQTGAPAVGGESDLWVYPVGDPAQDKSNVQWAVDNVALGGTVLLKARDVDGSLRSFDFGTGLAVGECTVYILRSCTVEGEVLKERYQEPDDPLLGQPIMATIENGAAVFAIWGNLDSYADRLDVNVRNLVSRHAVVHVIGAYDYADVEIDNVKIVDLEASPDYWARIALFAHLHGRFVVKNSMVRMKPVPFDVPLEAGIGYAGYGDSSMIGAELELYGNSVATQQGTAILIEQNALATDPKSVLVERNELVSPVGISATNLHGACVLTRNTVNASAVGLYVDTVADSTVRQNTIDLAGDSFAGLYLRDVVSSKVRQNRVAGNAEFGFLVEGLSYGDHLVIGEGDMSALSMVQAHVLLAAETHDNRLVLDDDGDLVVVDLGTNNVISVDGDED